MPAHPRRDPAAAGRCLAALLAAAARDDPFERPGTWRAPRRRTTPTCAPCWWTRRTSRQRASGAEHRGAATPPPVRWTCCGAASAAPLAVASRRGSRRRRPWEDRQWRPLMARVPRRRRARASEAGCGPGAFLAFVADDESEATLRDRPVGPCCDAMHRPPRQRPHRDPRRWNGSARRASCWSTSSDRGRPGRRAGQPGRGLRARRDGAGDRRRRARHRASTASSPATSASPNTSSKPLTRDNVARPVRRRASPASPRPAVAARGGQRRRGVRRARRRRRHHGRGQPRRCSSRRRPSGHVALLDLHLRGGTAAMMLGARLGRACAWRWRSRTGWTRCSSTACRSDLGPRAADRGRGAAEAEIAPTPEGVTRLLELLRTRCNIIVVDLRYPPGPMERQVLALARQRVLVIGPDLAGVRDAVARARS